MKTIKELLSESVELLKTNYGDCFVLDEAIHEKLQAILDHYNDPKGKMNMFVRSARQMLARGEETGLENSTPKKGSSRAVFFHKDPHKINLNGQEVHVPVVTKIAFPSQLDRYTGHSELLGEMQNRQESDWAINKTYGLLHNEDGKHSINEHGVLAPVFGTHEDNHYITMGKITPVNAKDIREATKNEKFPNGLTHKDIFNSVNHENSLAFGENWYHSTKDIEKVKEHPFVSNLISYSFDSGAHPADFCRQNMGIWHDPTTNKKHLVISDFGFSRDIAKIYGKARQGKVVEYNANRNIFW